MKSSIRLTAIFIIILNSIIFAQSMRQSENNSGTLILTVVGFKNNNGKVMIGLYNSREDYSETGKSIQSNSLEINDNKTIWSIEDLPFGEYAIKLYHDENGNGRLDRNMLGIPLENYGFSNNALANFGPAEYSDAKFIFTTSGQKHEIKLD